jgi:hypothetical protein
MREQQSGEVTSAVPTFLVAGAGRSGTTALVEGLRTHSQVFITDPKEPHYFALHGTRPRFRGPGDDPGINQVAVTREDDYVALYRRGSDRPARGEGSVSTFYYHERSIPEVLRVNPEMRVIVLLRDPVERAYSSFQYLRALGREPHTEFMAAVADEESRRADNWHHLWHYTGMSLYADALEAFRRHLPAEQVGVWFYEDLERDYASVFDAVLRFLDVEPVPGAGQNVPRVNASGAVRFAGIHQAMWWASSRPALRHGAHAVTTWRFREAVKTRLIRRQGVPADVRRQLAPRFEEDLCRLRGLLDRQAGHPPWLAGQRT